jgi:antitoxin HicB
MAKRKSHIGSDFDEFLAKEGILEHSTAVAIKRVVAWQIEQIMKSEGITKKTLAEKMNTSRSSLDRLLDKNDTGLTIETLTKAARALGRRVRVELAT